MGRILLRSVRRDARVSGSRASRGTGYNEMITIKRTAVIIFMIFFIFISAFDCRYFSYAEVPTVWQPLNSSSELVEAFQYYCKSRDLTIDGSVANAVTQFTTGAFNGCCNTLGINITQLQAELMVDRSNAPEGVRFLFSSSGIDAYNRIFAQFLQDNNLNVGDSVNDTVYDGASYNGTLVYIINSSISENVDKFNADANVLQYGSSFLYSNQYLYDSGLAGVTMPFNWANGSGDQLKIGRYNYSSTKCMSLQFNSSSPSQYSNTVISSVNSIPPEFTGSLILYKRQNSNVYHLGSYYKSVFNDYNQIVNCGSISFTDDNPQNNVTINIISNQINNNTYEGDTIINNYGTPEDDSPNYPLPDDNPYDDPDPDSGDPPSDWDIDLPDLDINWILTGKEKKFPWDIPFNLMFALSLLNAEPEAPHLEGTIDFGFTEWDYDLDLSDFDDVAEICRNFEFLAFLIGLMLMTRKLIWG